MAARARWPGGRPGWVESLVAALLAAGAHVEDGASRSPIAPPVLAPKPKPAPELNPTPAALPAKSCASASAAAPGGNRGSAEAGGLMATAIGNDYRICSHYPALWAPTR